MLISWRDKPIPVVFYAGQDKPEAIPAVLPGWGALAGSLLQSDDEMMGLDLKEPTERHKCQKGPDGKCLLKDGLAWSPVKLKADYRLDANVTAVTLAVIDIDHAHTNTVLGVLERLSTAGIAYVCHSTHSHVTPHDCCVRVIMPLSRIATAEEWPKFWRNMVRAHDLPVDTHCRNMSRVYFLPRIPMSADYFFREGEGQPLNVDTILYGAPAIPVAPAPAEVPDEIQSVEMQTLTETVKRYARQKKNEDPIMYALLTRIIKGEPLAKPGHDTSPDREQVPPGRDGAINKVASALAFVFPADTPPEAFVEVMRPTIAKTDVAPEGLDHWLDKARSSYARAQTRRQEKDAERAQQNAEVRAALDDILARRKAPGPTPGPSPATPVDDGPSEDTIRGALGKNRFGDVSPSRCNLEMILGLAPATKGHIRWNAYAKRIDITGGLFEGIPIDVLPSEIASWLERTWKLSAQTPAVKETIVVLANRNSYNPLHDYLRTREWDGTPRIDDLLFNYFQPRLTSIKGEDLTPVLKAFGRKWLIGAVSRALKPGSKLDTVLVLEGEEGIKKTTFFETLGGEFYESTAIHIGDKDAKQAASSAWIIELAEMAALKKGENQLQKAFLTDRKDFYRRPYGASYESTPRGCVFVGTVNPNDFYLPQNDKNRRYWCVYVQNEINIEKLAEDRDQLWAEAVHAYTTSLNIYGDPDDYLWWLTPAESYLALGLAAEKVESAVFADKIIKWWKRMPQERRKTTEFTVDDILEAVFMTTDTDPAKLKRMQTEIGIALRQLGFVGNRRRKDGRLVMVYEPTDDHVMLPVEGAMAGSGVPTTGATVTHIDDARRRAP